MVDPGDAAVDEDVRGADDAASGFAGLSEREVGLFNIHTLYQGKMFNEASFMDASKCKMSLYQQIDKDHNDAG